MMKHFLQSLIISCLIFPSTVFCQHLINATYIDVITAAQITLSGVTTADYDVRFYKVTYNTVDVHGNPTIASGMVAVPQGNCTDYPILAYHHGTVLRKDDVPSRNNGESLIGKVLASRGYVVAMPDYLGLGDNPGLHPYIHAESEATSAIDIMRATREFMSDSLSIGDNGQIFLTGYSQGGHACMATHKYIQDNGLENEFDVVASGPASGPYNLSGTQFRPLIQNAPYSNPGYIVYLLMSYELAYGNIYTTLSDVLQAPYDTLVVPYFDGTHDMGDLNLLLPNQMNQLLNPTFLQNFITDSTTRTTPLWQALEANDNYDWKPDAPVRMYYCTADEQVFYQNSLDAELAMNAQNASDVDAEDKGPFDHSSCLLPSLREAMDFFNSKKDNCETTSISEHKEKNSTSILPNPFRNELRLASPNSMLTVVKVYDLPGRLIQSFSYKDIHTISTSEWEAGTYIIQITQEGQTETHTLIKTRE